MRPRRQWSGDVSMPSASQANVEAVPPHFYPLQQTAGCETTLSGHYQLFASPMDFLLLDDPFEYPILPGVSLTDNGFGSLYDDLQLPLYDAQMDIEEQFLDF
ncbi:hypothetical protein PG995_005203 [Apiospora arundinis]